jgi:hypothetical protein
VAIVRRYLPVTEGNLRNHHIYLSSVLDLFPEDVIGGPNSAHAAPRTVRVEWGREAVDTDIAGDKKVFRKRGWLARFYDENRLRPGDKVLLEQLSPYVYRVSRVEQTAAVA